MINSVLSEPCTGRSSIEQRSSPRRTPYTIPHTNSSSSIKSFSSTNSRNTGRHEAEQSSLPHNSNNSTNNVNTSPSRPKHLSNRSLSSLANLTGNSNGSINKSPSNKSGQMASLSSPMIAKQHAHAATPVTSTKRDSKSLLASTAQQAVIRTAHTTTNPKPPLSDSKNQSSPVKEETKGLSNTLSGLHVDTDLNSINVQNSSTNSIDLRTSPSNSSNSLSDTSRSRSESITSSLATSVSNGQALGISLTGSTTQSAFKQHQNNLKNANEIQTSLPAVATQPPAPPSNAIGNDSAADAKQKSSSSIPNQHQQQQRQSQSQSRTQTQARSTVPTDNKITNPNNAIPNDPLQQLPPTIEQRDALAMRVYAACQAAGYDEWVRLLDLAPLASQHHLSGYNCIKFGQDGSPYAYLPLSLQQPAQVQEVLEKQKVNEEKASVWLTQKRKKQRQMRAKTNRSSSSSTKSSLQSPPLFNKAPRLMSKDEGEKVNRTDQKTSGDNDNDVRMRDASPPVAEKCDACKATGEGSSNGNDICECGPLKNEAVLSSEWEAPIGEDGCKELKRSESPENSANKVSDVSNSTNQTAYQNQMNNLSVKTSDTHPISISPIIPPELLKEISKHVERGMPESIRKQSESITLFDNDFSSDIPHDTLQVKGERLIRCRVTQIDLCEVAFKAERELIEAAQNQRKARTLKLNSPSISEPPSEMIRKAVTADNHSNIVVDRGIYCQTDYSPIENEDFEFSSNGVSKEVRTNQDVNQNDNQNCDKDEISKPFIIGNLLLSSCPGKKVRLTGPVRGRGAICRDLGLDLQRIRQLGVRAIVCCLDDEELAFLGAPWSEYEAEADKLGIEVIRLPMAEGFSPTDVLATDKAISCVVNDYTLKGVHVLVHCRGGVGRAGLIACTWMLKLGLVRSDRDELHFRVPMDSFIHIKPQNSPSSNHPLTNWQNGGFMAQYDKKEITVDIMQTIHRLIETIRRRRSPKAIETAEQVDFLVKYLLYLHEQEGRHLSNYTDSLLYQSSAIAQTA